MTFRADTRRVPTHEEAVRDGRKGARRLHEIYKARRRPGGGFVMVRRDELGYWDDVCARCGYARINLRHLPPDDPNRTYVLEGPPECEFVGQQGAK